MAMSNSHRAVRHFAGHRRFAMPIAGHNNLDELYVKHKLLQDEAARLEAEIARLEGENPDSEYILEIESRALREEAAKIGAWISDILDRDLQR